MADPAWFPIVVMHIDTVDAAKATQHIIQGMTVTRGVVLEDVPGEVDTGTLLQNALTYIYSTSHGVGPLGTPCPNVSVKTYLESVVPEALTPNTARLKLNYKGYPAVQIEIGTCLSTVRSNVDIHGNDIEVSYQYSDAMIAAHPELGAFTPAGNVSQGGFIDRSVQETTFTLKYVVTGTGTPGTSGYITASANVLNFALQYVGMVNKYVWASAPGAARCWLCESCRGTSSDGGLHYNVATTFHYRPGPIGLGESGSAPGDSGGGTDYFPSGGGPPSGDSSAIPYPSANNPTGPGGWDFLVSFSDQYSGSGFPPNPVKGTTYKLIRGYREGTLPVMPPPE